MQEFFSAHDKIEIVQFKYIYHATYESFRQKNTQKLPYNASDIFKHFPF
jgi:hypothetical protein